MNIRRLLGNRVYLEIPKKEKSKIVVDENTKEALEKEMLKSMRKLLVLAVGDGVSTDKVNVGDKVLVEPEALARKAVIVPLSDEKEVLLVSYFDIIHVWL